MYAPIVRTLSSGIRQACGSHVSYAFVRRDGAADFALWSQGLGVNDTLIWVGPVGHGVVPWDEVRGQRVHSVYYQTEPVTTMSRTLRAVGGCYLPPHRQPTPSTKALRKSVDELWDYSHANLVACRKHRDAPLLRYLPPGFVEPPRRLGRSHDDGGSAAPGRSPKAKPIFFGNMSLAERPRCVASNGLRHLIDEVDSVWDEGAMARVVASAPRVVNLHKWCLQPEGHVPIEAVRLSQILSAGGAVLSQHADPLDEASYRGLVSFAPLDELARRIRDASAWAPEGGARASSPEQRARAFERRFAPRELVARARALAIAPVMRVQSYIHHTAIRTTTTTGGPDPPPLYFTTMRLPLMSQVTVRAYVLCMHGPSPCGCACP